MGAPEHIVGIDLGTTHTVVASCPLAGDARPEVFPLPQLVTAREAERRALLPSVLYAPLPGEAVTDPWCDPPWITGEHARRRGASASGRLVASAKSWLCHPGVDRLAPILPWGADDTVPKVSPCDASALYLAHVRRAWDEAHPEAPLAAQEVVLTVPASFDEPARELTVLAAERAGLRVTLLEEPQAAFYDYRSRVGDVELSRLAAEAPRHEGALVLVCDAGGGTTDLSLLRVARAEPERALTVTRVAVGRHLLLGGDNMDLALAHLCESRMTEARLEPARFAELVLACRAAKEVLLGRDPPEDVAVTLAGPSSRLVGSTLTTRLTRSETESLVLGGFFPDAARDAGPDKPRGGLVGFGLPYERDVAITRHVAAFVARHAEAGESPSAVLLNGGVFHAPAIADRLLGAIGPWGATRRLEGADPDLAVARGAVAFILARRGRGEVIASGASRGYYVEVAADAARGRTLVCVVPRGTAEGERTVARGAPIELVVGRPARFEVFASDNARGHRAGDLVPHDADFDRLPPAFATFDTASRRESALRVVLEGELSAVGTLDLACVEAAPAPGQPPRHFRLAFALREALLAPESVREERASLRPDSRAHGEVATAIDRVFGKATDVPLREVKDLPRELARLLGERCEWTTATAREVFDLIIPGRKNRRRSADHERVFWQLAGFCLRPGVGDPGDPSRVQKLVELLAEKLVFADQTRGWQAFWIAWRRISAGLDEATQTRLRDWLDPFLATEGSRKKPKGVKADALAEMIDLASSLERVAPARRAELGGWLLERTWTDRDPRLWAALGRIGARAPAYATAEHVLPPHHVERWVDHLLREKWEQVTSAVDAAVRMSRVTGDRARDLAEPVRQQVAQRLVKIAAPPDVQRVVTEWVPVAEGDQVAFFGEGMPVGLRLIGSTNAKL